MNNRRRLIVAVGAGTFATPLACFAQQQPAKIARIGILSSGTVSAYAARVEALRAGLRDLGYVEGRNLVIEFRGAEGKYDRLPELMAELIHLRVDVLVTAGTPSTLAAKRATSAVPIVMVGVGDAVATGVVASLARPGGNITGLTQFSPQLMAKRLELLKEAIPRIKRVAALSNPANPAQALSFEATENTAKTLKVGLQKFEVRQVAEIESAFAAMAKQRMDAVVIPVDSLLNSNFGIIAELAIKRRLPSAGPGPFAEAGGLIGYGVEPLEQLRRAAFFVDKILKGVKPGDIPVEQPTRFDLVINVKTAKAIGVNIPQTLMQRADKIIK